MFFKWFNLKYNVIKKIYSVKLFVPVKHCKFYEQITLLKIKIMLCKNHFETANKRDIGSYAQFFYFGNILS